MVDQSASFVGSIPENYDRHLGPVLFKDFGADLVRRVAASKPARVLETAAGTGIVTRMLRDALPGAAITATDLNPPMLAVAAAKFRGGEGVTFQQADAGALPFADGSFDAVACQFGIMFFPDKAKSFREAYRVLAPGGRYVFNVWDAHRHNAFAAKTAKLVEERFPVDPPGFYHVPFGYHSLDAAKEGLEAAGFTGIRASVLREERKIASLADFTRGLVFGNPLIDQMKTRGGVDPEKFRADLEAILARAFAGGSDMAVQTIVYEATKA